jgi:hypothetical protein
MEEYINNYELIEQARDRIVEHEANISELTAKDADRNAALEEFTALYGEYEELFANLPEGNPSEKIGFEFPAIYAPVAEAVAASEGEIDTLSQAIEELDWETIRAHLGVEIPEVPEALEALDVFITAYNDSTAETQAEISLIDGYAGIHDLVTEDALTRNWNLNSHGYYSIYGPACDGIDVNDITYVEGSTYKMNVTLSLGYNYPNNPSSFTHNAEYYVDISTGKITQIVFRPESESAKVTVEMREQEGEYIEVRSSSRQGTNYETATVSTAYFNAEREMVREEGVYTYASTWKDNTYESVRTWETVFGEDADTGIETIRTTSEERSTYNGVENY